MALPPVAALAAFATAMLPIIVTPGASFTLASTQALAGNRRGVRTVVLGTGLGILTHASLAAAGLSAIVMRSAQAYEVVRVLGGLYLLALGATTLLRARASRPQAARPARRPLSLWSAWTANVLNPKAAAVYLTIAPQFLSNESVSLTGLLALAAVHTALMAAWLLACGNALRLTSMHRRGPAVVRIVTRLGGTILIALGIRTLAQTQI